MTVSAGASWACGCPWRLCALHTACGRGGAHGLHRVTELGRRARSPYSDTQAKMDLLGEEEVARVRWVKYVGTERNLTIGGKKIKK